MVTEIEKSIVIEPSLPLMPMVEMISVSNTTQSCVEVLDEQVRNSLMATCG